MAAPGPSPTLVHVKLWNRALALAILASVVPVHAQWQIENSGTTADLRGIDNIGGGIAWASGSNGTVLRTEDGGYLWQPCAVPPGAEHLDFRGIQAFDADTAIVMSSGKGDLSRLYKTTDGCETWKLVFTNPDKDGFWDAMLLSRFDDDGYLLGDPVNGSFRFWETDDKGLTWENYWQPETSKRIAWEGLEALPEEGAFAASNSALFVDERYAIGFATGGPEGGRLFLADDTNDASRFHAVDMPLRSGSASTGAFSIESRDWDSLVAVGGDYARPDNFTGTAAYSKDGGEHWRPAQTPPHGFRSAVAYDAGLKTWITVGPNGTDVSTDDGKNWRAVHPDPALREAPDADRNWNALSLPYVVGPHGRIGKLDAPALSPRALAPANTAK
jgi:photosystem II stability/assembly factor-like uncharacterized protein